MNQSPPPAISTGNKLYRDWTRTRTDGRPRVDVAIIGAQRHYAVPKLLHRAGMLGRFYTDLYAGDKAWAMGLLAAAPPKLRPRVVERFLGRFDMEIPADRVVSFDAFGLWYWWQLRRARDKRALNQIYTKAAQVFNRRIIRHGLLGADVLYGCNSAALELFEFAKEQGIPCILEQTIAPRAMLHALLRDELERWPGWEPGMRLEDGEDMRREREQVEWRLADLIIGTSSFVIEGLRHHQVPEAKSRLVPYGVSLESFSPVERQQSPSLPKLRILFAGEVGLRKGVPYLLEALRLLNSPHIEASFVGQVALSRARLQPYQAVATFLGQVPRSQMLDLYRWADLFVFPSICEGSALVTYEALASGLPVIATPNSGAWVRDGIDGVIVPIRHVEALAATLERFIRDREFLRFCSHNALASRDRLGLDAYQRRLQQIVREVTGNPVC